MILIGPQSYTFPLPPHVLHFPDPLHREQGLLDEEPEPLFVLGEEDGAEKEPGEEDGVEKENGTENVLGAGLEITPVPPHA